jgi:hypothetical protein
MVALESSIVSPGLFTRSFLNAGAVSAELLAKESKESAVTLPLHEHGPGPTAPSVDALKFVHKQKHRHKGYTSFHTKYDKRLSGYPITAYGRCQ